MRDLKEHVDHVFKEFLEYRGVEMPCGVCNGMGTRTYGSNTTWRGGIGGQVITLDVCNSCWGTGDKHRKGVDLIAMLDKIKQLQAIVNKVRV